MPTQLPSVPSLIPSSFATLAIGRDVSITIFTASSLNSGEKLFFGRGKFSTFQIIHPNGRTVRKARGTSDAVAGVNVRLGGGVQAGDGNMRVNEFSRDQLRQEVSAGRDAFVAGGDLTVNNYGEAPREPRP